MSRIKAISAVFALLSLLVLPVSCGQQTEGLDSSLQGVAIDTVKLSMAVSLEGESFSFNDGDLVSVFDSFGDSFQGTISAGNVSSQIGDGSDCIFSAYPYDSRNSIYDGLASVFLPEEQKAVEGGYDHSAWLGLASSKKGASELVYKPYGAIVSFTIPSDDLSFVRLSGARGEKLSGGLTAIFGTSSSLSDEVSLRADSALGSESVTLSGNLTSGKEYSVIVLPQTLSKGFDITLGKKDGTTSSVKGTSEVLLAAGKTTHIGLDGTVPDPDPEPEPDPTPIDPVDPGENDLYTAYQAGKTITVCGVSYNKATHGDAALVNAAKNESLSWYFMNRTQKVIFLSADEGCFYFSGVVKVDGVTGLYGEHVAISRYANKPVTWKFSTVDGSSIGEKQFLRGGSFAFKNINFDMSAMNSGYAFGGEGKNPMGDVDRFHFDGCTFSNMGVALFYTSSGTAQAMRSLRLTNCKFLYSGITTNHIVFNFASSTVLDRFEELVFENNVVCSEDYCTAFNTLASYSGNVSSGTSGTLRLSVKNNIFYNAPAPKQLVKAAMNVSSATMDKNIFYSAKDPGTVDSSIKGIYMFSLTDANQKQDGMIAGSNLLFAPAGVTWFVFNPYTSAKLTPEGNELVRMEETPFASFDAAKGVYELKSDYVSYGPQK